MKISELRDGKRFQEIVHKLLTAEFGDHFQVVDDSGGDGGLDGYNRTTKCLYAIYCPEKPSSADYRRKIGSDMEKAVVLRDEKGYDIRDFAFVTAEALREPVLSELRNKARQRGFESGIGLASVYLEVLLRKHPFLIDEFPELHAPKISEKLDELKEAVERIGGTREGHQESPQPKHGDSPQEAASAASIWLFAGSENDRITELSAAATNGDFGAIAELKRLRSTVTDPETLLRVMSILVDHYFEIDADSAGETLATEAAVLAKGTGRKAHEAHFRAVHARSVAHRAAIMDTINVRMAAIGAPMAGEVKALAKEADEELQEAVRLAVDSRNLEAFWQVLFQLAMKEVLLARPHMAIGNWEAVRKAESMVRMVFERLQSVAPYMHEEVVVRTLLGYSSALKALNKGEEAVELLDQARSIATAQGLDHWVKHIDRVRGDEQG